MSKPTHVIVNGENVLAILWENDKHGKILVVKGDINPNFDLEIRDCQTTSVVSNVDLREFLFEILPVN